MNGADAQAGQEMTLQILAESLHAVSKRSAGIRERLGSGLDGFCAARIELPESPTAAAERSTTLGELFSIVSRISNNLAVIDNGVEVLEHKVFSPKPAPTLGSPSRGRL